MKKISCKNQLYLKLLVKNQINYWYDTFPTLLRNLINVILLSIRVVGKSLGFPIQREITTWIIFFIALLKYFNSLKTEKNQSTYDKT